MCKLAVTKAGNGGLKAGKICVAGLLTFNFTSCADKRCRILPLSANQIACLKSSLAAMAEADVPPALVRSPIIYQLRARFVPALK